MTAGPADANAAALADAAVADLPEIAAIYAHHVLAGTGTFETVPPSIEAMADRHRAGLAAGYTWLVARDATGVLGFGYYGAFRPRAAYRWTVEDSVYVRDDVRGQGVGKLLVGALVARAEAAGFRQMFALIGDSENIGSIGVHASLGFARVGVMRAAGLKFGRWLDVVIMQRALGAGDTTPAATSATARTDVSAQTYDAVLIGAGHNALVCAYYLARRGLKVALVERRAVAGGAP